jgi:hypothetical protein
MRTVPASSQILDLRFTRSTLPCSRGTNTARRGEPHAARLRLEQLRAELLQIHDAAVERRMTRADPRLCDRAARATRRRAQNPQRSSVTRPERVLSRTAKKSA